MLALGVVVLAGQALLGVDPQDEGQFLTYPWLIAHGHMPYRDIWMSYPPATYVILALIFKLGVPGLIAERGVGLIARVAYVILVNRSLTRSWTRFSWPGVFVTFGLLFISSDIKAYPWLVALPLLLAGLLTARQRYLPSALLFFLAGTFRFEFGVAGCVTFLTLAGLCILDRRSCRRELLALGALAFALAAFYALLDRLTHGAALQQIFTDQILLVEPARRIPLIPPAYGPLGLPLVPVTLLGPALMLVAGLRARRPQIVATNLAVMTLLPHFFQRADASHLFSTAVVTVPWLLIGLTDLLTWSPAATSPPSHRAWTSPVSTGGAISVLGTSLLWVTIGTGLWCSMLVLGYAVYLSPLSPLSSSNLSSLSQRIIANGKNGIIGATADQARDDRQVIAYLERHGRPDQRVFITPLAISSAYTRTDLYYALGFEPASIFMEVQGGVQTRPAAQQLVVRQLERCAWVIVVRGGMWYRGPDANHIPRGDLIQPFLRRHFRSVLHNATYRVLEPLKSGESADPPAGAGNALLTQSIMDERQ